MVSISRRNALDGRIALDDSWSSPLLKWQAVVSRTGTTRSIHIAGECVLGGSVVL